MHNPIIPVLPLRDIVVFPQMVVPLFVGRKLSVNALNNVMKDNKEILLITQKDSEIDNPNSENSDIDTFARSFLRSFFNSSYTFFYYLFSLNQ